MEAPFVKTIEWEMMNKKVSDDIIQVNDDDVKHKGFYETIVLM